MACVLGGDSHLPLFRYAPKPIAAIASGSMVFTIVAILTSNGRELVELTPCLAPYNFRILL